MRSISYPMARIARVGAPFAVSAGLWIAASFSGCADSDDVASTTGGTTTQSVPPGGDSLPAGAISFFHTTACPEGWAPFGDGAGRAPVPTVEGEPNFATQGEPLAESEDRVHGHAITATATLDPVSYAGVAGEANHGVAAQQDVTVAAAADEVSSGLPYIQLLMCKKLGEPRAGGAPIPRGLLVFWNGASCPDGWSQPVATQGRVPVGVPQGATPGLSFGGEPLAMGEARTHGHDVAGTLATAAHGIALAGGCCADGYAANGAYPYSGSTDASGAGLPTIHLLQCQKL